MTVDREVSLELWRMGTSPQSSHGVGLKSFTIGWTEDGQVTRLHVDCPSPIRLPLGKFLLPLGDEELVYLFYYFGFPSTLVLAINREVLDCKRNPKFHTGK